MRSLFFVARLVSVFLAVGVSSLGAQVNSEPTPHQDPTGSTGALKGQVDTGCSYDPRTGNGTRSVTDLKVPGALGDYGLDFTRYWNSLPPGDTPTMPAAMPFGDFGVSGWTHSWAWTALEEHEYPQELPGSNGDDNLWKTSITITFPDGHTTKYQIIRLGHGDNGIPGDPRFGPPYETNELNWPSAGGSVKDYLCNMAPDGSTFWLHRADGSSVFFGGGPDGYVAYEIYDPHGFKTTLSYDALWRLIEVKQEGGRWLTITWGYAINGGVAPVISRVETGGYATGQAVNYTYAITGNLTLATVDYSEGADAVYTYEGCLLKAAVDPRFAGPMKKIRYTYRMARCRRQDHPPDNTGYEHFYYFYAQPEAVASERSYKTNALVSGLDIHCFIGTRKDYNGLGGWRIFYYGRSAMWPESGSFGYELAKVTDFYIGVDHDPSVPSKRQSHLNGDPYRVWDGRGNRTQLLYQDSSGQPSEVKHLSDGNKTFRYNRSNSNTEGSDPVDPARIRNPQSRWLFSQTDERGLKTIYRRDSRRRVKEIIHPWNTGTEYFTYNDLNQVVTHTLASGAVQTYVYDALNRLEREYNSVDGPSAAKIYTYDALGRVRTVSDCRSRAAGVDFSTRMTYNGRHQITQVEYAGMENSSGNVKVQYGYDSHGNCTSITNELGQTRTYSYDDYRRCVSHTEPLNAPGWDGTGNVPSRTWTWIYDRVIDGAPQGDGTVHTSKEWRVQIEPAHNAAGDRRMTARTFDLNNRISREQTGWIQPAGAVDATNPWYWTAEGETHYFTYDENGMKKTFQDPMGRVTSYEYDTRNRLWKTNETINSIPRTTETLYDGTGNKIQVIFPDGKTQRWENHDPFGQPGRFIDERNNVTDMMYWPWGPMKKLAQVITHRTKNNGAVEDQRTSFWPDALGRPWTTGFPDDTYEQTTYECGQLKTFKTRKGQTKTVTAYDARGREGNHIWSDGTPGVTRLWDPANRLLQISNVYSKIEYSYDAAGQVGYEWNTVSGSVGVLGKSAKVQTRYCRYPNGKVARLQYPNGVWTQREYTARGQLKTVSDTLGGGAMQSAVTYSYHFDGKVDWQSYGNGVLTDLAYDPRGFVSDVWHRQGSTNLMQRNYHRDSRDRITSWQKGNNAGVNPRENGRGDRYLYDDEGQLTDAWYNAADPHNNFNSWERKDFFNYDQMGNRHGWNDIASKGHMLIQRRDNGLNQYHSWENDLGGTQHWGTETYYDDNFPAPNPPPPNYGWVFPGNGVMMADGFIVASYNALNQPVAIGSMAYAGTGNYVWFGHDPLGRCVKRIVGPPTATGAPAPNANPATYFYYDGWNLIQEGSSASVTQRVYVHGGRVDEIVHSRNYVNPQRAYHQYDARGHCTLLTGTTGQILEQYEYDAFGWPYFYHANGSPMTVNNNPNSVFGNRFLFTGREWLSDLRLYDYRHRHYQPELGRFLQPDPLQFAAGDYNLYRYCHNDPVNKSDPTGEIALVDDAVLGAIFLGAAATIYLSSPQGQDQLQAVGMFGLTLAGRVEDAAHTTANAVKDAVGRLNAEGTSRPQGKRGQEHTNPDPKKAEADSAAGRDRSTGKRDRAPETKPDPPKPPDPLRGQLPKPQPGEIQPPKDLAPPRVNPAY